MAKKCHKLTSQPLGVGSECPSVLLGLPSIRDDDLSPRGSCPWRQRQQLPANDSSTPCGISSTSTSALFGLPLVPERDGDNPLVPEGDGDNPRDAAQKHSTTPPAAAAKRRRTIGKVAIGTSRATHSSSASGNLRSQAAQLHLPTASSRVSVGCLTPENLASRGVRASMGVLLGEGGGGTPAALPLRHLSAQWSVGSACSGWSSEVFALEDITASGVDVGYDHTFCCDISSDVRKLSERLHSPPLWFDDVTSDSFGSGAPYVDLFVAGFPCQPFSLAGLRQGLGHCARFA